MTPLERAARALHRLSVRQRALASHEADWDNMSQRNRDLYVEQARAVLQAIREPSDKMVRDGERLLPLKWGRAIWQRMIVAALEEGTKVGPLTVV